jgi:hypothetical protein
MSGETEELPGRWSTLSPVDATVLVVVHTVTSLMRMVDYIALIECDRRVRVYWTIAPDKFNAGVAKHLDRLDVTVLPWAVAITKSYDLAICTSLHQVEFLHAKKKFAAPHGCGYGKKYPSWAWPAGQEPPVYGLDRESLLDSGGRPVFDGIVLPHLDDLSVLIRQTPEVRHTAVIGGDLAFDRLLASLHLQDRYRYDLGVRRQQKLVALASTWGTDSLLARFPDLPVRLQRELPTDHRVIMTIHPAAWYEHGPRQIYACLRDAIEMGLDLVGPGEEWRHLLVAADVLIGDHTSLSCYAAAAGVPVLFSHYSTDEVAHSSLTAELIQRSPLLHPEKPLLEQLSAAVTAGPRQQEIALPRISSVLGESATVVRRALYELMTLSEPGTPPRIDPI